ncbi:hypothetical protein HY448_02075 [Candidatus Pacearchaeota archaeon]|nr:hypothetical protein [Candidatus Pacearchaeota archaeon]
MKKGFIFPLSEDGIQFVSETDSFAEAQEEYKRVKEELQLMKTEIIKVPKRVQQKKGIYEHLLELKTEGFFLIPKTIGEIKDKLAELAVHKPVTSFPPYLNSLIREKILKRSKQSKDGREVWTYENGI